MDERIKVKSITPAIKGWWAKFVDDGEEKTEWYTPVAAWALCDVKYAKQRDTSEHILPVLTCEFGMEPHHPSDGYCQMFYMPDHKFELMGEPFVFSWKLVEDQK